ncbi:hypothetical protein TNCT_96511 [Trichonephila clavata]|uniref:Uncharacterized protein n=1 Tax=Trichonephila clavata TaxID=2740835 RepID=A0A8X6GRX2_TRICU|nr:hypothetical protein TNCT_96511 [Trichonephila clavata]
MRRRTLEYKIATLYRSQQSSLMRVCKDNMLFPSELGKRDSETDKKWTGEKKKRENENGIITDRERETKLPRGTAAVEKGGKASGHDLMSVLPSILRAGS